MRSLFLALIVVLFGNTAEAMIIHVARQGDTVSSLAVEYYGDVNRSTIIRAINQIPQEGDVDIAIGEQILLPETTRRIVRENETWRELARQELGAPNRAWYLAHVNNANVDEPPQPGTIITIPYLLTWSLIDGLPATITLFYSGRSARQRIATARLLYRLNPGLRPRGMARGTRIILPFTDLNILPAKRAEWEQNQSSRRTQSNQNEQSGATERLERLNELLSQGSYTELIFLAGQISGSAELTEAQRVTLHRYLGQAYLALDCPDLARQEFVQLLQLQPDFQFDQVTTSPTVVRMLETARRGETDGD